MSVADGAPGFGTAVLSGLPQGNLLILGAVLYLQFTKGNANISATFNGDYSLGSAPTADGVLAGAEVDLIPSTSTVPAVSGTSSDNRATSATATSGLILDNTDGSLELNLNLLVDDADISGASTMTASGALHLAYCVLGDD
jgi:hypothetical protein